MKVVQWLDFQGPWWQKVCRDMHCLCHRSYGPIGGFCQASCNWRVEGLFGQSFSIAPPIQALRGLPCLGSFSVVRCIRHIEGRPWLGSYSVVSCIIHLKEHPGWVLLCSSVCQAFDGPASLLFSCRCYGAGGEREAMVMAPPPLHDSAVSPCFHGCPAFLHRHFPPLSPLLSP